MLKSQRFEQHASDASDVTAQSLDSKSPSPMPPSALSAAL